jgi:catechol 2,3-dioxygenase-like lactoylglutathione lyase family enzyme
MSDPSLASAYSHIGICVADIEAAQRFYTDALGFTVGPVFEMTNVINALVGIPGNLRMTSQMLQHGNLVIELIHFQEPQPFSGAGLRPMNQIGLTHLSFIAEDVDALAARLETHGGKILHETRTVIETPGAETTILLFCTDPDGTRIELYQKK